MATSSSAKKQIIDSIKEATNILVTVSKDPTIDELSAAMGLTIFLNKLGKHATAVASGEMPPAIQFLEPDKTFEDSADSLRDFIIALDKEKADHLSYKLVDDVVRISITPYRTTISEDDLEFSQGDYNVELVLALNVANSEDLDVALSAHGKILHDATVATITSGGIESDLGAVDWHSKDASSVSEMITELLGSLKTAKATLDEQISTALLTGVVAATDRFGNNLTSSRAMSVAAELMASGANQQLIASRLETNSSEASEEPDVGREESADRIQRVDGSIVLEAGISTKVGESVKKKKNNDDELGRIDISHGSRDLDEVARKVTEDNQEEAAQEASKRLNSAVQGEASEPLLVDKPSVADITEELRREVEAQEVVTPAQAAPSDQPSTPLVGGTLNATTEQAAADKRREAEQDRNRTILSHANPVGSGGPTLVNSPINASMIPEVELPMVNPIADTRSSLPSAAPSRQGELLENALAAAPSMDELPSSADPTIAEIEHATLGAPKSQGLSSLPPMPDFSTLPPIPDGLQLSGQPASVEANPGQFHIPEPQ